MIIPVLSFVETAKDASSITLKDATGAYNGSTNTGGYGTPNADEPTKIGLIARYWADTEPYGNLVSDNGTLISELLATGTALSPATFGLTGDYSSGIHHFKYYPLETIDSIVTLTNGSKLVTVTAGTAPDTYDEGYIGIVFGSGTKVYLIDWTAEITSTTFYLTEAFGEDTATDVEIMLAPEEDLKVLVYEPANTCLVERIGKLGSSCSCNEDEVDKLMNMLMQIFAAQVNADCKDYTGAHNKIVRVDLDCNDCKTTCACS